MICKKCNAVFTRFKMIDGKFRNLSNRKFCLSCSPFGKHNTKKLNLESPKVCIRCNKPYESSHGNKKGCCNSCSVSLYRINLKKEIVDLFGGKCVICGYDKCFSALEFHHLDPKQKEHKISGSTSNKKKLIKEANKCILVCVRCHREIHSGIVQWQNA